jgi:hypothetical protein
MRRIAMTTSCIAAFICYLVAAIGSIGFGLVYLARSTFMPYHRDAISTPWEKLEKPYQALFLGLIKVAGGGFMVSGLSVVFMASFPFRAGEEWARFAIPIVGLSMAFPALFATVHVRRHTPASPPVATTLITIALLLVGFALSMV